MPRGTILSSLEQGQIQAFHSTNMKISEIAKRLNRSKKVIYNFLKNVENYGQNKTGGPKRKLTNRERRQIVSKASNTQTSCASLARMVQNKVTRQTIWRVLQGHDDICRQKLRTAPKLTWEHKKKRLEIAKNNMNNDWSNYIFSDEKKWNLDGPDGWNGYWRDLRKEPQIFSKRNFGGGSLMTWGAFAADGVLEMQVVSTRMNSMDYTTVLQCSLLPYLRQCRHPMIFQQDNAPIHTSRHTREWLQDSNIQLSAWPACSPDLNPIENIWGILARRVYNNNKQYNNVAELQSAVVREWNSIDDELITTLFSSMPNRIFECIKNQGAATTLCNMSIALFFYFNICVIPNVPLDAMRKISIQKSTVRCCLKIERKSI